MPKLAVIGGYLGAGKTTLIVSIGRKFVAEHSLRVAIVTNDQGDVLVDSRVVGEAGFPFVEVQNGCFCCRFPDFMTKVDELVSLVKPDLILAEPVGSCTDLIATVYNPLKEYHKGELDLAPYVVLVDAKKVLNVAGLDASKDRQLALMAWQLQEADLICINKVDLIDQSEQPKVLDALKRFYFEEPECLFISAKTGYNLNRLCDYILNRRYERKGGVDVDYDMYAAAEADLGWFNGSFTLASNKPISMERAISHLLSLIGKTIVEKKRRIAHLKLFFSSSDGAGKASLLDLNQGVIFDSEPPVCSKLDVVMNIRAELSPEDLSQAILEGLRRISAEYSIRFEKWSAKGFTSAYPQPYYRIQV
jgi:G3E family GTPase